MIFPYVQFNVMKRPFVRKVLLACVQVEEQVSHQNFLKDMMN